MKNTKSYNSFSEALFGEEKPFPFYEKNYYAIRRRISDFMYSLKKVRQRIRNGGFPDEHWFEFRSHCASWAVPRLKMFNEKKCGYPHGLTEEEWTEILNKMIWSFEHIDDDIPIKYSDDYSVEFERTENEDGTVIVSTKNKTGSIDFSDIEKHNDKVQEGLDLFAKYYMNLWD